MIKSKAEIRKYIKQKRKSIGAEEELLQNDLIFEKLSKMKRLFNAPAIYCYMDQNHEVATRRLTEFLWSRGIEVAVPRVEGQEIRFYYIRSMEDLEKGCMGIMEPKDSCVPAEAKDAPVIVPGVAFDRQRNRLGYGGGYYDRFFEKEPGHYRIGIAFDFQIVPEVPVEGYDRGMDEVISAFEDV